MYIFFATAVAFVPVFTVLGGMRIFDGYKLVRPGRLWAVVGGGCLGAAFCWAVNYALTGDWSLRGVYETFILPLVEECAKAAPVLWLVCRHKVGFTLDAGILGFAAGTGFALVENIFYLSFGAEAGAGAWAIRGFGTALMHGTTTFVVAVMAKSLSDVKPSLGLLAAVPGLLLAWGTHAFYNTMLVSPTVLTALLLFGLPLLAGIVFLQSETTIERWLGAGFDRDVERLKEVTSATFSATPSGRYLKQVAEVFPPETVVDIHCYVRLWLELAIRAKGRMLMAEAEVPLPPDHGAGEMLREVHALERSIGRAGLIAVSPLLPRTARDYWQIQQLSEKDRP